jgi:S-adenosylmethionine synthetase
MIEELDLLKQKYSLTAYYGHFGRCCPKFSWEEIKELK